MEQQLFIYSRTLKADYGVLAAPSQQFMPAELKQFFKTQVRGLLNVDEFSPDLSRPRWLLSRVGCYTLWGVGCWNEAHGETCTTDDAGRRHLRSFVGIVYKGEVQEVPYDLTFFSAEFNRVIAPMWSTPRMELKVQTDIAPGSYEGMRVIKASVAPGLNRTTDRCVVHNTEKAEGLIATALLCNDNVSVATALLDARLAFDERYQFMNVCMENASSRQEHQFKTESKIPEIATSTLTTQPSPFITHHSTPPPSSLTPPPDVEQRLKDLQRMLEEERRKSQQLRIAVGACAVAIAVLLVLLILL